MKLGLKIWSINHPSFIRLNEFYQKGYIDYVELYTFPESFSQEHLAPLLDIPIILHAPTFPHGMNLAEPLVKIAGLLKDIQQYIAFFKENKIIFHPGVMVNTMEESIEHTILNLKKLKSEFDIILENVPAIGIDNKSLMVGADPVDFKFIKDKTRVKSCLDFGHAINSANYRAIDPFVYIMEFLWQQPFMFHLSDGHFNSHIDVHLHYKEGTFPLKKLIKMIPNNGMLSLETPKIDFKHLSEDLANLALIKKILDEGRR